MYRAETKRTWQPDFCKRAADASRTAMNDIKGALIHDDSRRQNSVANAGTAAEMNWFRVIPL